MNARHEAADSPPGCAALPSPDCTHCGFTSHLIRRDTLATMLRELTSHWQHLLRDPGLGHCRVGSPRWSPLEHACHTRDMCELFLVRLEAMLRLPRNALSAGPRRASRGYHQVSRRYRDEDPRLVAVELGRAARTLAQRLTDLTEDDWNRGDPRLVDPRLTVDFFTRHLLHDIAHALVAATSARTTGETRPPRTTRND